MLLCICTLRHTSERAAAQQQVTGTCSVRQQPLLHTHDPPCTARSSRTLAGMQMHPSGYHGSYKNGPGGDVHQEESVTRRAKWRVIRVSSERGVRAVIPRLWQRRAGRGLASCRLRNSECTDGEVMGQRPRDVKRFNNRIGQRMLEETRDAEDMPLPSSLKVKLAGWQ